MKKITAEEFALTVSGYTDYKQRIPEIIADVIAGAPTLANLVPQTGAKANTTVDLNILATDVTWSNANCVDGETGNNTVLSPRPVAVKRLSDRELLCLDELDAKLPIIQSAGAKNDSLPFEEVFIDLKVKNNSKWLEKLAWQGNTVAGVGNLGKATGYLKIADGETGALAGYDTFSSFTPSTCITLVNEILDLRTPEMYESDDVTLYMDLPKFSMLSRALTAAFGIAGTGMNLDTANENQSGQNEFMYPGTNVRIKGTHGLNGNGSLFLTMESNLRYATDLESDKEEVDVFYDKYHKKLVSDLVFAIGFQYQFPEQAVYYKYVPAIS